MPVPPLIFSESIFKRKTYFIAFSITIIQIMNRYGMKAMAECSGLRSDENWIESTNNDVAMEITNNKLEMEIQARADAKTRADEQMEFVTYPSALAEREWRDDEGDLTFWQPPGYFEETEDVCSRLLYKTEVMDESQLPAVYVKKEAKRDLPTGSGAASQSISSPVSGLPLSPSSLDIKPKIKREDTSLATAPKSLFDRPKPFKTISRPRPGGPLNPVAFGSSNLSSSGLAAGRDGLKTVVREVGDSGPEWLIQEDWALHQAVLSLQEMPLTLSANSPAHISNWDMVADMVAAAVPSSQTPLWVRTRMQVTMCIRKRVRVVISQRLSMRFEPQALASGVEPI